MAEHLRFDASTGVIQPRTFFGQHTEFLLQLNDDLSVKYRLSVLRIITMCDAAILNKRAEIDEVEKWFNEGKIDLKKRDAEVSKLTSELVGLIYTLESHNGELPLRPIKTKKFKVSLTTV